jgi:hypothetical protein
MTLIPAPSGAYFLAVNRALAFLAERVDYLYALMTVKVPAVSIQFAAAKTACGPSRRLRLLERFPDVPNPPSQVGCHVPTVCSKH